MTELIETSNLKEGDWVLVLMGPWGGTTAVVDMVLVSDDLFSLPPEKIRDAKVLQTWVAGKVVFSQEK